MNKQSSQSYFKNALNKTYWLDEPLLSGKNTYPNDGQILVIGSGVSGSSAAYWLAQKGYKDVTVIDYKIENAATFRNCGHVLYGTVESIYALTKLHGKDYAASVTDFSVDLCHEVKETSLKFLKSGVDVNYKQDGYYVLSIDEHEQKEIELSTQLLNKMEIANRLLSKEDTIKLGFKNCFGGRLEAGGANIHPVKFRNELMRYAVDREVSYHSGCKVKAIQTKANKASVTIEKDSETRHLTYDAVVICANAYSPLFSSFCRSHALVEPFRGQILTSQPLRHEFKVKGAHSFNHGYEYALVTTDNRLMLGGWRDQTAGKEVGTYDLTPNPEIEKGLDDFAQRHYNIEESIEWQYSWSGIMASSKTSLPFIGPTDHPLVFVCAGFTGHGLSWSHGSAKLCIDMLTGESVPAIAKLFKPE